MKKNCAVAALSLSAILCGCTRSEGPASQANVPPAPARPSATIAVHPEPQASDLPLIGGRKIPNSDLLAIAMITVATIAGRQIERTAVTVPQTRVVSAAVRDHYGLVVYQIGPSTGEYIFAKSNSHWKIVAGGELSFNSQTLARFGVPEAIGRYLIAHQVPLQQQ